MAQFTQIRKLPNEAMRSARQFKVSGSRFEVFRNCETNPTRENHAVWSPGFSRLGMNSHERVRCSDTLCSASAPPPEGGTPNHGGELPNEPNALWIADLRSQI